MIDLSKIKRIPLIDNLKFGNKYQVYLKDFENSGFKIKSYSDGDKKIATVSYKETGEEYTFEWDNIKNSDDEKVGILLLDRINSISLFLFY